MNYGRVAPSMHLISAVRDDIDAVANQLADAQSGSGKIAKVAVIVTFGDGTSICFETERTPTP